MPSLDRNIPYVSIENSIPNNVAIENPDAHVNQAQYNINCSYVNPEEINVNSNYFLSIFSSKSSNLLKSTNPRWVNLSVIPGSSEQSIRIIKEY